MKQDKWFLKLQQSDWNLWPLDLQLSRAKWAAPIYVLLSIFKFLNVVSTGDWNSFQKLFRSNSG